MCLALAVATHSNAQGPRGEGGGDSTIAMQPRHPVFSAVKTNLAYDCILVPNISYEHYLGHGYSIGGSWWYTWWRSRLSKNKMHWYWRSWGGELNFRKYLGKQAALKPLTGHHVGALFQGYMYDSDPAKTGYMSDFTYNIGLEYGYSVPVLRRLNIDFGLAVGYVGGKYKVYKQRDMHYVWQETRNRSFFGPVKVEITLAYQLGKYNINKGKEL